MKHSAYRSSLAKARGLGSAKDGTSHWWWERVTSVLLIPLTIWLIYALMTNIVGKERSDVIEWLSAPEVAIALLLFFTAMFYHSVLGLQVVIEDYFHNEFNKLALIIITKIGFFVLTLMSWLAILKLHLFSL